MGVGAGALLGGAASHFMTLQQLSDEPKRRYWEEVERTMQTQEKYGGRSYLQNMLSALQGADVGLTGYESYLFGRPAGTTVPVSYDVKRRQGQRFVTLDPGTTPPEGFEAVKHYESGAVKYRIPKGTQYYTLTRDIKAPETRGLFSIMGEAIPQMAALQTTAQREQALGQQGLLAELGPGTYQSYMATLDPARVKMLNQLQGQVSSELAAGAKLDPGLLREYQQIARAGQAARGRGFGAFDQWGELLSVGQAAEQRRLQRQNQAMQLLALRAQTDPNVAGMILGGAPGTALTQQLAGSAFGQQSAQFNPMSYLNIPDFYSSNQSMEATYDLARANQWAGMAAGLTEGGFSMMGAGLGGS